MLIISRPQTQNMTEKIAPRLPSTLAKGAAIPGF